MPQVNQRHWNEGQVLQGLSSWQLVRIGEVKPVMLENNACTSESNCCRGVG
jgi:hypothetical protein